MNVHALIIDPQNDFTSPQGSLYVKGAEKDMDRLALMISRLKGKLADIHVTLDSHRLVDISHPAFWVDDHGKHPDPFTVMGLHGQPTRGKTRDGVVVDVAGDTITGKALATGAERTFTTFLPSARGYALYYLDALAKGGRYPHVVWPPHTIIGDEGHNVWPALADAIHDWETSRFATTDFVTKGSNTWVEHFSAVKAEVADPTDPTTQINAGFVRTLEQADMVLLAGEALSHCLARTVEDVDECLGRPEFSKFVLLTDASSSVGGFEQVGADFVAKMTAKGMRTATTSDVLATL